MVFKGKKYNKAVYLISVFIELTGEKMKKNLERKGRNNSLTFAKNQINVEMTDS